jgi:hypothetical protein
MCYYFIMYVCVSVCANVIGCYVLDNTHCADICDSVSSNGQCPDGFFLMLWKIILKIKAVL